MHPLRLLFVEDNPDDADLLLRELRRAGFEPEWSRVDTEVDFLAALQKSPEIILSDYSMPHFTGLRALELLRASGRHIPFILISGTVGEDVAVQAMRGGATDYLLKDRPARLGSAVTRALAETQVRVERHQAELAQARLAAIVTFSDDAIIGKTLEGTITSWNAGAERVFGYTQAEAVGQPMLMLFPPDRVDEEPDMLARVARRETVRHFETVRVRKGGATIDVSVTLSPLMDQSGQVVGISAIARDITERKAAEEAVRTADERTRFALKNADVGIWDMDYTTGVLRWSETLEAHYGVPPGTFAGTFDAFIERVHPDDRAALLDVLRKALKAGSDFSMLNRALWPDGTIRSLSGSGRVILGTRGEPVRVVGISLDVTERRELEEQFQQAQKMEAVGRLAGGVAHDFNNLLTVILGYCELLLLDIKSGEPHLTEISEIQKAGQRAGGLTRQLLAFSRKQIIEPTVLDLNSIATELRAMLGRLIGEDVNVVLRLKPGLAAIKADRGQVEQVMMNLAVNARDAMPHGGTLTIETSNVELDEDYAKTRAAVKPGSYVVLTVTDTGIGMTPEVQARLFEPFFTTKEVGKGTGLGLATVYGIVTRDGGTIEVDSEVGRGTSFKVFFPKADGTDVVMEVPAPLVRPQAGTHTVLVVEDEAGLRVVTRRLLQHQGYTVLVAANADEALRLFDANPSIDVLLTDVVMPGASGPELTRQLVARRPTLRVIYMSGYTEDAIVHHGVLQAGIAFLHKPFTSHALGQKISQVLER